MEKLSELPKITKIVSVRGRRRIQTFSVPVLFINHNIMLL